MEGYTSEEESVGRKNLSGGTSESGEGRKSKQCSLAYMISLVVLIGHQCDCQFVLRLFANLTSLSVLYIFYFMKSSIVLSAVLLTAFGRVYLQSNPCRSKNRLMPS